MISRKLSTTLTVRKNNSFVLRFSFHKKIKNCLFCWRTYLLYRAYLFPNSEQCYSKWSWIACQSNSLVNNTTLALHCASSSCTVVHYVNNRDHCIGIKLIRKKYIQNKTISTLHLLRHFIMSSHPVRLYESLVLHPWLEIHSRKKYQGHEANSITDCRLGNSLKN